MRFPQYCSRECCCPDSLPVWLRDRRVCRCWRRPCMEPIARSAMTWISCVTVRCSERWISTLHWWSSTGRAKAAIAKRQLKNGLIANMLSFCATVIVPPPLVGVTPAHPALKSAPRYSRYSRAPRALLRLTHRVGAGLPQHEQVRRVRLRVHRNGPRGRADRPPAGRVPGDRVRYGLCARTPPLRVSVIRLPPRDRI